MAKLKKSKKDEQSRKKKIKNLANTVEPRLFAVYQQFLSRMQDVVAISTQFDETQGFLNDRHATLDIKGVGKITISDRVGDYIEVSISKTSLTVRGDEELMFLHFFDRYAKFLERKKIKLEYVKRMAFLKHFNNLIKSDDDRQEI